MLHALALAQLVERLIIMQSKPSFAIALRLFAAKKNYPMLVHCIHGKDRTGLIIMLLLLICNVPPKVSLQKLLLCSCMHRTATTIFVAYYIFRPLLVL